MISANLKIGQTKALPPEFVDQALRQIGHNSGRCSPLVAMAVDPVQRPYVESLVDDGVWQMLNAPDAATNEKWFIFAKTVKRILMWTRKAHVLRSQAPPKLGPSTAESRSLRSQIAGLLHRIGEEAR